MRSYTAEELEKDTGFDRRTIAYYVQEGLIPKVGRRGPRTRYPALVRDRLLFIRRVREAEEAGGAPPVSLGELREIFRTLSPVAIAKVAHKEIPVAAGLVSSGFIKAADVVDIGEAASLDMGSVLEGANDYMAPSTSEPVEAQADSQPRFSAKLEAEHGESELGDLLAELQEAVSRGRRDSPALTAKWVSVEITPQIAITVRGLSNRDAALLENIARRLRRLLMRPRRKQKKSD